MIISHKHRFIFVKTRKTAGTSIEISLSRYCGPEDIITPLAAEDEKIRSSLGVRPKNYEIPNTTGLVGRARRKIRPDDRPDGENYYNHMPARLLREYVESRVWRKYIKFCFVRNPWDYEASLQRWENQGGGDAMGWGGLSLAEVIERPVPIRNWLVYTIDGEIAMDFVGRYERLTDDLAEVCRLIGLPYDGWLPHTKQTSTGTDRPAVFTPDLVQAVRDKHHQEIAAFGYSFEPARSRAQP